MAIIIGIAIAIIAIVTAVTLVNMNKRNSQLDTPLANGLVK